MFEESYKGKINENNIEASMIPLCKWLHVNQNLAKYLQFYSNGNKNALKMFHIKRGQIHSRLVASIVKFKERLSQAMKNIYNNLTILTNEKPPKAEMFCFSIQTNNMELRKLVFAQKCLQEQLILFLTQKYSLISNLLEQSDTLISLFSSNLVPDTVVCQLNSNFFVIDQDSLNLTKQHALRLSTYIDHLKKEVSKFEKPLWITNYPKFLSNIVKESISSAIPGTQYVSSHESELQLSLCFFYNESLSSQIDTFLNKKCQNEPPQKLIKDLLAFSYEMIPSKCSFTPTEHSIALLFIFRTIFNRFYEKFESTLFKSDNEINDKLKKISELSTEHFVIPLKYVPNDIEENENICKFFQKDEHFVNASLRLEDAIYVTNPIDGLYHIFNAIKEIQKGASINKMKNSKIKTNESETLSFDDLFSILFGCFIASNTSAVYSALMFLKEYSPDRNLSPSFEYCKSMVEAIIQYTKTFGKYERNVVNK